MFSIQKLLLSITYLQKILVIENFFYRKFQLQKSFFFIENSSYRRIVYRKFHLSNIYLHKILFLGKLSMFSIQKLLLSKNFLQKIFVIDNLSIENSSYRKNFFIENSSYRKFFLQKIPVIEELSTENSIYRIFICRKFYLSENYPCFLYKNCCYRKFFYRKLLLSITYLQKILVIEKFFYRKFQ